MSTPDETGIGSTRVAAYLREAILGGDLRPGDRIRQEEIAAKLGASRLPVREALRMLEAGPRPTPEKRPGFFQRARERGEAMAEAELDAAALRSLADWKRFPRSRGR